MRFPLNNHHICAVEVKPGLGGDIAKPPNSSCVYKACTRDVQGMYKGCTREQQAHNTVATPKHHACNTLSVRCAQGTRTQVGGGLARGYLGDPELADALEFVPAVESPAEEAQHPQIAPAAAPPDPPALGQDVTSQPPAIRHGVPIGAAHKAPTPDQCQGGDRFEEQQAEL